MPLFTVITNERADRPDMHSWSIRYEHEGTVKIQPLQTRPNHFLDVIVYAIFVAAGMWDGLDLGHNNVGRLQKERQHSWEAVYA